ncbi:sodium/solute symporter [Mediterraneibacter catenae]|uniref:Sodium/solute symporter n=1 Tax=Mediterraneibacter catenae TaxID=2594882 RepID=A0A5M9HWV0_9FIRM|nr:sodium/solute symporter [Mediterraneibacter catenae]KAA8501218.1 sodium/solute symporter [Mediterraneibacter catenae]
MGIKIILLVVFFAIMVGVGIYARRHATSVDGFVLGGRSVGPWLTAFAYGTSYFSAVVFVGYAGQFGWKYGIASTWIGIGNAVIGSLLAWVVLGRRTKIMTQHLGSKTMPDFFGQRYSSKALKIAASVIVFVFLIPYTASVYNGLSRLFEMAFNIPYAWCVIAMAVFTALYVILGGYMATAINDFIQGIIMLIGIVAVIAAVLNGQGGFMNAVSEMAQIPSDVAVTEGQPGAFTSFFGPDPLNLLGVVILTSLGTWGLPQMIGKFYAIKDEKSINTGTVISTLFAVVVSGGCYFLGGFARLFDSPQIYDATGAVVYDSIIPYMLSALPDILIGIVVVLVLSASMSTLSSLVLTSSSTMTLDLIKDNVVKDMSEKKQIITMQVLIVFFLVVSVVIALDPPTFIAQLMGISWGALAGAFLAPFMYGLYWKGVTRAGVWAGFIVGVGLTVANMFIGFIESSINAGAAAMVAGLIVVPVVSLISPKLNKEKVDDIFECYEEKVVISKKRSLQE